MHQNRSLNESPFMMPGMELESINPAQIGGKVGGRVPRKFIPEHGTIYFFTCVRVKPTYDKSKDYLLDDIVNFGNPRKLLAHPAGASAQPEPIKLADLFSDSSSSDVIGYVPWNHWHRSHSDYWNPDFENVDEGWPQRDTPTSKLELRRHPNYDEIFSTNQFGNGQIHSMFNVTAMRNLGATTDSVKAPDMGRTPNI